MSDTTGSISFRLTHPHPIGYWVLFQGHGASFTFQLSMYRRPRWLVRWAMRVVFDIHWRDV